MSSDIVTVLQARVSSTRLPGKVMLPILGQPMLARQLQRIARAQRLQQLIVATSTQPEDDPLQQLCRDLGVICFRGSLSDVLDRVYQAVAPVQPCHVVRLTGDCPLADPQVIDACIAQHLAEGNDYTSNALQPTWPDGLDVEVCRFSALQAAWQEARLASEREHVMPFIWSRPERFRLGHLRQSTDLSALRWTVDEPADFVLVNRIYEALYPGNPAFTTADILAFLDAHADLKVFNLQHARNEGYAASRQADE